MQADSNQQKMYSDNETSPVLAPNRPTILLLSSINCTEYIVKSSNLLLRYNPLELNMYNICTFIYITSLKILQVGTKKFKLVWQAKEMHLNGYYLVLYGKRNVSYDFLRVPISSIWFHPLSLSSFIFSRLGLKWKLKKNSSNE